MCQPGIGSTDTDAIGGNCTAILVVLAVSLSVGTWNVSTASSPALASGLLTVTCATAGPASANTTAPHSAATRTLMTA